jgi:acyl carrier protein
MTDRLCITVANALGLNREEVSDTTSRINCGKWDSLQHFFVILAVEKEYGIRFSSGIIPELASIAAIRHELIRSDSVE